MIKRRNTAMVEILKMIDRDGGETRKRISVYIPESFRDKRKPKQIVTLHDKILLEINNVEYIGLVEDIYYESDDSLSFKGKNAKGVMKGFRYEEP
ncbi:hypothetical protein [Erysipelothrix aquatica]|uniref:hypothetical protein n=1 Tax=Erysipelothrix aquatica TaxID=2683714 RepID=UPI0013567B92|nr:hypothetical protein [Erysipelothrix aquatica]